MEIKQAISERVTDENSDSLPSKIITKNTPSTSLTNFEIKAKGKSVYCQEIIGWLIPRISSFNRLKRDIVTHSAIMKESYCIFHSLQSKAVTKP